MNMKDAFFFDIETVTTTDQKILDLLYPLPEKRTKKDAPKNWKDKDKIQKWIDKKREEDLSERETSIRRGALDIDSASIRSIAYAVGNEEIICTIGSETEILKTFLEAWKNFRAHSYNGKSVGYNSINYDWSVILRRTVILGLGEYLVYRPNMNRYTGEIDLANVAYNFGFAAGKMKGMKVLSKILGIEAPAGDKDGSMVADMDDAELIKYNISDVYVIREMFKKFNGVYL